MTVEVELDVFSGKPNPRWSVSEEEIRAWMEGLSPEIGPQREPPGLGYRGLVIHLPPARLGPVRVHGGLVQTAGQRYSDPGRRFEAWLLAGAGHAVDPQLLDQVRREIQR